MKMGEKNRREEETKEIWWRIRLKGNLSNESNEIDWSGASYGEYLRGGRRERNGPRWNSIKGGDEEREILREEWKMMSRERERESGRTLRVRKEEKISEKGYLSLVRQRLFYLEKAVIIRTMIYLSTNLKNIYILNFFSCV